jgi:N-acetylmuramoyl-L-alanine amidase
VVKIYLDAGHGGHDGGASSNGIKEKDIVLTIVKKMKSLLNQYNDVQLNFTRETDVFLSLSERTKKANNWDADCFVSVHVNSATNKSARGYEDYRYSGAGSSTIAFQNIIHSEIMKQIGGLISDDRGKKTANFHVLRESKMKAILTENLFISNSADANLLKSDSFLDKVAQGHVNGLVSFYGLKKKAGSTPTNNDGKLFKIQVGAYEEKKGAESVEMDLIKQGFQPFIKFEDGLWKIQCGAFEERSNAEDQLKKLQSLGYRPFIKYE